MVDPPPKSLSPQYFSALAPAKPNANAKCALQKWMNTMFIRLSKYRCQDLYWFVYFQLCYVSNDTAIVCQLPAYNLSQAFLASLTPNTTDTLTSTLVSQAGSQSDQFIAQLIIKEGVFNSTYQQRQKRDIIAQFPAIPTQNETFSLSLTMGITLDGYDFYQDIKAAIPDIDYRLKTNLPNFFSYYTPNVPCSPGKNSTIQLYVSLYVYTLA